MSGRCPWSSGRQTDRCGCRRRCRLERQHPGYHRRGDRTTRAQRFDGGKRRSRVPSAISSVYWSCQDRSVARRSARRCTQAASTGGVAVPRCRVVSSRALRHSVNVGSSAGPPTSSSATVRPYAGWGECPLWSVVTQRCDADPFAGDARSCADCVARAWARAVRVAACPARSPAPGTGRAPLPDVPGYRSAAPRARGD